MSYMRAGHPLKYFKGVSHSYVFPTEEDGKRYVEDYDDKYNDNASFIELIGNIVLRETADKKYAEKIMRVLSKKLKVKMLSKPKSDKEWFAESTSVLQDMKKDLDKNGSIDPKKYFGGNK